MRRALINGCFDGLHEGHKFFIQFALLNCDALWILVNSDASVKALKGEGRPRVSLPERLRELGVFTSRFDKSCSIMPFEDEKELNHMINKMIVPEVVFKSAEYIGTFDYHWTFWVPRIPGYSTASEIERRRA